jgi:hypothetical protein
LTVQFYDGPKANGVLLGTTVANIAAEQGVADNCGGNANHRFVFATPNSIKNGVAHSIYAYAVNIGGGSDFLLNGSPQTITCAVNGTCSPTHYNCTTGTLGTTADYTDLWQWWCNGSGGGANILCSEYKPGYIQGVKVLMPGNVQGAPAIGQTVTLVGSGSSTTTNPYFFYNQPYAVKAVSVSVPAGYSVASTLCYGRTDCHTESCATGGSCPVTGAYLAGNSRTALVTAGSFVDLWWHYTLNALPPTCSSITPNPATSIDIGASIMLTGNVTGSNLTYAWSASGGSFSSTVANPTTWTAPGTAGIYNMFLRVTNSVGFVDCPARQITVITPYCSTCGPSGNPTLPLGVSTYDVYTYGVQNSPGGVSFGTWSNVNGQDDFIWYPGVDLGGGTWRGTINFSNHPFYGQFYSAIYLIGAAGEWVYCCSADFIRPANNPPVCSAITALPASVHPGGTSSLDLSATDTDGTIASYLWSATAGSLSSPLTKTTTWTAPGVIGSATINATVTDNLGTPGSCPSVLIPILANNIPVCTISGNSSVSVGGTVLLTSTATDSDGTIASYSWVSTGGSLNPTTSSSTTWTAPLTPGLQTVTLTVRDNDNGIGVCSKNITVINNIPVCTISGNSSVGSGGTVLLTSTATDSDGTIASYSWVSTGGSLNPITNPSTTWTAPATLGSQTITLTVKDNLGAAGVCTKPITVTCATTYTLNVTVKDSTPPASCGSLGSTISGATVTVVDNTVGSPKYGQTLFSDTTPSSGTVSIPNIPITTKSFSITSSKVVPGPSPVVYTLSCPNAGAALITFASPAGCSTQSTTLGLQKAIKSPWSVVLDGDVYASAIYTPVPSGAASGGFKNFLINSPSSVGGIAMSEGDILISRVFSSPSGAYSKNISSSARDVFLSRFKFSAPTHSDVKDLTIPATGNLSIPATGTVYKATVSAFNTWIGNGDQTYSIPSSTGVAVLYLTGSGDVNFTHNLTNLSAVKRLIIVAPAGVVIRKEVGQPILSYAASSDPNIMVGIIASGNITFESQETNPGSDLPVMVTAPLISNSSILLNRDLGDEDPTAGNGLYPAQAIKYYLRYIYGISDLEYSHKDIPNYTGLRSFDVQFVFDDWNTYPN